jgi:hypothetical protein
MTLDASGNLGLGVTPSAWSLYKAFQNGGTSVADYGGGNNSIFGSNMYFDGSNFKYISSYAASSYRMYTGKHEWNIAASGTAGNAISFTQAMTLDASGNLGIGTTNVEHRLDVSNDRNAVSWARIRNNDAGSSAYAGLILNAYGNTWGFRMGSSAANSNTLQVVVDVLGTPVTKFAIETSGNQFVANTSSAPGSNPSGGGYLYVESGALKYRGSSGTVTTIANA